MTEPVFPPSLILFPISPPYSSQVVGYLGGNVFADDVVDMARERGLKLMEPHESGDFEVELVVSAAPT